MEHPYHQVVTVDWVGTTMSRLIGEHAGDDPMILARAVADAVQRKSPRFDRTAFLDQVRASRDHHHPAADTTSPEPTTPAPPVADN